MIKPNIKLRGRYAHRDYLHRRRGADRQDRQYQFQLSGAEARRFRALGQLGDDRRRRARGIAGGGPVVGRACGFALDIDRARFFLTPGLPRELRRMLEEQIIPRLLARSGVPTAIYLKRFHSYGLGESHVDQLLAGVEELVPDGSVKLGFRTHYPQIETKLTVRGADMAEIETKLAPVQAEVRRRLGNFIIAEDDQTLERVILACPAARGGSLSVVETFTGGQIAGRIAHLPGAEKVFRRGLVARDPAEIAATLGLDGGLISGEMSRETAQAVARAARGETGASHALALLIEGDDGPGPIDFGGRIHPPIASQDDVE